MLGVCGGLFVFNFSSFYIFILTFVIDDLYVHLGNTVVAVRVNPWRTHHSLNWKATCRAPNSGWNLCSALSWSPPGREDGPNCLGFCKSRWAVVKVVREVTLWNLKLLHINDTLGCGFLAIVASVVFKNGIALCSSSYTSLYLLTTAGRKLSPI